MSDDPTVVVGGETAAPVPPPAAGNGAAPPNNQPLLNGDADAGVGDEDDPQPQAPSTWPDDWRERWAGKDEQALKTLKRWGSPDNVFKSWLDQRRMISAGQLKPALAEGATEDEVAAYRKSNGVPESPDGYGLEFPANLPATDAHKAQLASFQEAMHGIHAPPQMVKTAFETWTKLQQEAAQRQYETNQQALEDAVVELRTEYGRDYKRNVNIANGTIAQHAGDDGKDMMSWALADGRALGSHPAFVRMMVSLGLATVGDDALVLNDSMGGGKSIDEQITEGLALVNTDPKKYDSPEHQARMIKLYTARQVQQRGRGEAA